MSSSTSQIDDRLNASTSQTGTPVQSRRNILERVIKEVSKQLGRLKFPNDDDDDEAIQLFLRSVWANVQVALNSDPNLEGHLENAEEFVVKVEHEGKRDFISSLKAMEKSGTWASLIEDEIFLKPNWTETKTSIDSVDPALVRATELAWSRSFQGDAHLVLTETIADLLDKRRSPYARLTSLINSSGTGKSRMVDQLGMKIITVPMCLRSGRAGGFPPPDGDLRDWLVSGESSDAQGRLYGFMYSLLTVTRTSLETLVAQERDVPLLPDLDNLDIQNMSEIERNKHASSIKERQVWLASTFRKQMTMGQSFKISNKYRRDFYDDVILLANKFMKRNQLSRTNESGPARHNFEDQEGVAEAGERLCRFVDPHRLLDSAEGPRWPLVVFAFDEAHILTDNPPSKEWSLFLELRLILRKIHKLPIFSLFLSTAGRLSVFSPGVRSDRSNRVRNPGFHFLDPITEISFDDIAYPALEDTITLDRVVKIDWMSHLGRPLFGSRWDAMEYRSETELMDFAKQKLLNGPTDLANGDRSGSLACLSVRFALEFNTDRMARDVACAQVERHMRLCLVMTTDFEELITLAGSEPLLAEAAYELLTGTQMNAVCHLAHHSDLNCIDRGRRGELVAVLIVMHARDEARRAIPGKRRWISVVSFMKALLPPSEYETLRKSRPTFWRAREDKPFEETFQDYGMWFNHVIKIEDNQMISVNNLWKFVTRGAMILCSTNEGVDIVLPLCDTKRKLSRDSVTAILIQVRNSQHFEKNMETMLFDAMSPFDLGMFPEDGPSTTVNPKPVIRLVFALASSEAGVVFREGAVPQSHPDAFTAFDIWLAGLSTATFRHISGDLASYHTLLERSMRPHDEFELLNDPLMCQETRKLRGSHRRRTAPLASSRPDHGAIHRGDE